MFFILLRITEKMANRTDVSVIQAFGSNPQYLISNIIRSKIYDSQFWKEKCFAVTAESIIDLAVELKYVGGTYGGNRKPTHFLCLILKLLQIQPDKDIIYEYIKNEEFIYLRALGCFYLRLVGKSLEIYKQLEPALADYRKIRVRKLDGTFEKMYMDVFVDNCLTLSNFLDVDFPKITKREILEYNNLLEKRNYEFYKEMLNARNMQEQSIMDGKEETENKDQMKKKEKKKSNKHDSYSHKKRKYSSEESSSISYSSEEERRRYKRRKKTKRSLSSSISSRSSYKNRSKHKRDKTKRDDKRRTKKYLHQDREKEHSHKKRNKDKDKEYYTERKKKKEKDQNTKYKKYDKDKDLDDDRNSVEEWNKLRKQLGMKPLE